MESLAYRAFHDRVIAAIRTAMCARWPPRTASARARLERNVQFFNTQCTYDEPFAEGLEPEEFVDDEIDAAL